MGVVADRWLAKYVSNYGAYETAAEEIKKQITEALKGNSLGIHLVETRAKTPDSVAEKIERRNYGNPRVQFDDLLGARVITLFDHSVDETVKKLRSRFDVDDRRSVDKTKRLKLRQVGYRSHHLVVKAREKGVGEAAEILKHTFVEVQVRSVLAHAWAEIEHSLRYKIGEGIPNDLGRRFDALAGALELADREFSGIEAATVELVDAKAERYRNGADLHDELTTVHLLAALMSSRPSMRPLGPHKLPLPIEDAFRYSKILVRCQVLTVGELHVVLAQNEVLAAVERYAALVNKLANLVNSDLDPDEASATVVLGAVTGRIDRARFDGVKAFTDDPLLVEALG